MALDLDGYKVLRKIGKHPEIFAGIGVDVKKAARTLVMKHLKAKSTDLEALRGVRDALGEDTFGLVVDGMTDAELKSLSTKLDKNNTELKVATASNRRTHIQALADGRAGPLGKAPKAASAGKPTKSRGKKAASEPKPLNSLAIAATLRRRD